ncbi:MAG: 5-methyltetrahydropteroyltriglutamate--homocysteine S-methyltransferase [Spirochaetaceae bacterium]|jgi:5-methyltetrahydropteroyltriglutamate--homocysteine methyltransferase|nr:5-methyltetrahydropteroyltriglutamate--homocysteine S-methyltransferase [Spirochaetaceae bacterium]
MAYKTLITGYPRIGENRELKKALEAYWAGDIAIDELKKTAALLRKTHWLFQKEAGIDFISVNDFSYYDTMLDTCVMLGAIPQRFRSIADADERYFAMARGNSASWAMSMTKWFNTNYHFIIPELDNSLVFKADSSKILSEYDEARALGIDGKINIIGPLTFLGLSKTVGADDPYDYFDAVISAYMQVVRAIAAHAEDALIQFDEPIFARDPSPRQLELLKKAYTALTSVSSKLRIIVTTYFEHSNEATFVLGGIPVWGIGLDFVQGARNIAGLSAVAGKTLIAGLVDGRNIWVNDAEKTLALLAEIAHFVSPEHIVISTSCSLLHTPYSLEKEGNSPLVQWLAFAKEKVHELVYLAKALSDPQLPEVIDWLRANKELIAARKSSSLITDAQVSERMASFGAGVSRVGTFAERNALQKKALALPELPTTTIGSFPQTAQLRALRRDVKAKRITEEQYEAEIKRSIDECIAFQEEIGLDVLVHGEPERNDMVEYFGEMLKGFHFTKNAWVQSYGSRCVKPPLIYGDISRPYPMTVKWLTYAQSKTAKVMKGMLTGPVTILNWSFVRDDIPRSTVARQIALSLFDEVNDLQTAGIRIVQVDEAAFKEGYPLRKEHIGAYENWAVDAFRLAVSGAKKETQIHTHMCYSDFSDSIHTIEKMDADVITIETARSGNRLLAVFQERGYANEIGPGVYDIHSPRIPDKEEFIEQIKSRLKVLARDKMWVNPDCGLKTRTWEEVRPALHNMVEAARTVRHCYTEN